MHSVKRVRKSRRMCNDFANVMNLLKTNLPELGQDGATSSKPHAQPIAHVKDDTPRVLVGSESQPTKDIDASPPKAAKRSALFLVRQIRKAL